MFRTRLRVVVLVAAGLVSAGAACADDGTAAPDLGQVPESPRTPAIAPHGFYAKFLAPRMDIGLNGEVQAAIFFTNPAANPWTQDNGTVSRVERRAVHATKSALKNYAIDHLGINAWSIPLFGTSASGVDAFRTESGGTRLVFGFSHLAPRAEVLVPVSNGRVSFSADAMGRVGTSYEMSESKLRFGASFDPRAHDGAFSLACGF
jgi:hypothetical protein